MIWLCSNIWLEWTVQFHFDQNRVEIIASFKTKINQYCLYYCFAWSGSLERIDRKNKMKAYVNTKRERKEEKQRCDENKMIFEGIVTDLVLTEVSDTEVSALKNKSFEFFFSLAYNTSRTHFQIHSSSKNDAYVFVCSILFHHYNTNNTQT